MLASDRLEASLTPIQLREILVSQPHRRVEVAVHPEIDEALRQWLWENGDDALRRAVYAQYLQQRERLLKSGDPLPAAAVRYDAEVTHLSALATTPQTTPPTQKNTSEAVRVPSSRETRKPPRLALPDGTTVDIISERVVIGRRPADLNSPGAQLVKLEDPTKHLSSSHALLVRAHDGWRITDLHSGNGTLLASGENFFPAHPGIEYLLPHRFLLAGHPIQFFEA
ncbi:FHA domain-containing protein [Leucobacter insecticola]|uniref:FHA domain-containing protein n=1 Tax=Leucobacter insecticola TaxID=2714934 RepID=A0A6G8FID0_9MICO|nr:FHA domain-containing protein [Leucobacter insecticola]QIM16125.1 FHA domain-containing protein [Leucobacter insecticola]